PPQLVYKHSIVSVAPMRAPSAILGLPGAADEGGEEGEERAPSAGAERAPSAGAELAASVEAPRG
ncbi:MAG: hypothetical protein K0Q72_2406, partial [Armatimonadetes bacterium]|nr:hypothetical protein [Armatimonadota bacterium]